MVKLNKIKKRRRRPAPAPKPASPAEPVIELDIEELQALLEKARTEPLSDEDATKLGAALEMLGNLGSELDKKKVSIQRLKQMLFGQSTEKTETVFKDKKDDEGQDKQANPKEKPPKKPAPGHGRNGADCYTGGTRTEVKHPELKAGDPCPDCQKGTVYQHSKPARLVRISGHAPLRAGVYELEKLRCHLCGKVFTAPAPQGVGEDKYDAESAAMIALLKYGSGVPFNRLARLQGNLGVPLPTSNQWEIVQEASDDIDPVYRELIHQAAQGQVLHNDDTTMKILKYQPPEPGRKGIFTSGIVSVLEDNRRIALFFTGQKHAGENLMELLRHRDERLDQPVQMCDALSRNMPEGMKVMVSNCLVHGRRGFVEVADNFPEECLFVLETLKTVYHNDDQTKGMTDSERLAWHQAHSGPVMEKLYNWMNEQLDQHQVEPNSTLGGAIRYMIRHWEKLTLFLREPGAPLDNNICERALKKAILHRKNAYFYQTENGARVGDLYMSLIHTCELNQVNPFDYLTELQKNKTAIITELAKWLPWNYRDNLQPVSPD